MTVNTQDVDVVSIALLVAFAIAWSLLLGWVLGYGMARARYHAAMRRAWRRRSRVLFSSGWENAVPEREVDRAASRELERALFEGEEAGVCLRTR